MNFHINLCSSGGHAISIFILFHLFLFSFSLDGRGKVLILNKLLGLAEKGFFS